MNKNDNIIICVDETLMFDILQSYFCYFTRKLHVFL